MRVVDVCLEQGTALVTLGGRDGVAHVFHGRQILYYGQEGRRRLSAIPAIPVPYLYYAEKLFDFRAF